MENSNTTDNTELANQGAPLSDTPSGDGQNSRKIPWFSLLEETWKLIKRVQVPTLFFFGAYWLTSFASQFISFEPQAYDPGKTWMNASMLLVIFAVFYFIFVSFSLWLQGQLEGKPIESAGQLFKNSSNLMIPLTILSIRGGLVALFGLILFIIPGIYFIFKYQVATYCLIFEEWKTGSTPILRAKQLISKYRYSFLFLAAVMCFGVVCPAILEQCMKIFDPDLTIGSKLIISFFDAGCSVFTNIYTCMVLLHALNKTPHPLET